MNTSVETVNAAAAAIASAESRVQQDNVPRRKWSSRLKLYLCLGSHPPHRTRVSHAVLVPNLAPPPAAAPPAENPSHPSSIVLPFIAPPSSPVSFQQSGPPSATFSPAGGITLSALSSDIYSPGGGDRPSIFSIGPYANETQLVSPPVFSTFTTEPSTAPFTPPPEPVQFTTPSSPEVPFAKLLTSNSKKSVSYEFNPGSPVGHLISPCSARSAPITAPMDEQATRRSSRTLPNHRISVPNLTRNAPGCRPGNELPADHRVSFELTAEELTRCLGRKSIIPCEAKAEDSCDDISFVRNSGGSPERPRTSITLLTMKEFKFTNSEGSSAPNNNWAFFPLIQSGVS